MGYSSLLIAAAISAVPDEATVERVRREYPEAAAQIEEVYSKLRIDGVYDYSVDGQLSHRNHVSFWRDGLLFRYEREAVIPSRGVAPGHTTIVLATDSAIFDAARDGHDDPTTAFGRRIRDGSRQSALMRCFGMQQPSIFELYGVSILGNRSCRIVDLIETHDTHTYASGVGTKGFVISDATPFVQSDEVLIRLTWINRDPPEYHGSITMSPTRSWIVVASEWSATGLQSTTQFEFDGEHAGVPLISRGQTTYLRNPSGDSEWTRWNLEVESIVPGAIDPTEFDPERLRVGLPIPMEPELTNPDTDRMFPPPLPTQRWYQWLGLFVVIAMWIAVRQFRKRRS